MTACPKEIISYMHDYLDGDISEESETVLKTHLKSCDSCQKHYHELTKTIAFIQSASHIQASPDFVGETLARLPKEKPRTGMQRWLKRHPFLVSAALFCLLMSTVLFSNFQNDQHFAFTKQPNLVVEGETVIVPEGETVAGDLTVRNGDLRIEGEVDGNVTIINGSRYMASTGVVTGEIEEIDQAFEWLWYTIKNGIKDAASVFTADNAN